MLFAAWYVFLIVATVLVLGSRARALVVSRLSQVLIARQNDSFVRPFVLFPAGLLCQYTARALNLEPVALLMDRLAARACTVSGLRFPWVVNISSLGPAAGGGGGGGAGDGLVCVVRVVYRALPSAIHSSFVHRVRFFDLFSRSIWSLVVCHVSVAFVCYNV